MELSEKQRKHLRRLAHPLHPIVMLGNAGLTDGVLKEFNRALRDHELIKASARCSDRRTRDALLEDIARQTGSLLVQRVGNVAVFYRRSEGMPKVILPDE
jgi:RNA-binding protein